MLLTEPQIALPIEDQILEAIISGSLPPASDLPLSPLPPPPSPLALASHLHPPLSKVLDILASPLTRSRIAAAQELRDLAFHQREQLAREKALAALESILDTTEDPIEKRRAATAILRRHSTRNPFWPRTPGAGALDTNDDLDDDAPPRTPLPAPEHPRWCHPPRDNLVRLLTRLQDNHNPKPDSGLTTLFHFKEVPGKRTFDPKLLQNQIDAYLDDPGEDAELLGFSCAILHTPDPSPAPATPTADPDTHTERVTLHWPDHHRTACFHFRAFRNPGPNAVYWYITDINIGPKETSTHDSS